MAERPGMRDSGHQQGSGHQPAGKGAEEPLREAALPQAPQDRMPGGGQPGPGEDQREPAEETEENRDAERRRRRALFLRELHEAKELRARVQPRRARAARMREHMRMRTFRWQ